MQNMVICKKFACFMLAVLLMFGCFAGCKQQESADKVYTNMADLENAKIGLITGTMTADLVPTILPDAQYQQFNTASDVAMALESGVVDAYPIDESIYLAMLWENMDVNRIKEPIEVSTYGIIFGKGENLELQNQFNAFLADTAETGELGKLESKWFATSEPVEFLSYEELPATNGTLKVGLNSSQKPFVYLKDGQYTGFDVEMLILFAKEYGYQLDFEDTQFGSVLTGVSLGAYDLGISGFTITEERAQSIDFSDVYHEEDLVMVVRGTGEKQKTLADYQNARIGVATGTYGSVLVYEKFPDAEIIEYNTIPDMLVAMVQGKCDTIVMDGSYYICTLWEGMSIGAVNEPMAVSDYGFVFKKDENIPLRQQLNTYLSDIKENGELDQLQKKWFGEKEPTEFLDYSSLSGTNGTIKVITTTESKPFTYLKNQAIVGYDIEILTMFAEEYGYQLEITDVTFSAILLGVAQGTYDIGVGGFSITEERAQSVDFSDPYYQDKMLLLIPLESVAEDADSVSNTLNALWESFEKTFIRENRWKLILEGVVTTMIISFFAVLGGSILGFLLYLAARSQQKAVSCVTKFVVRVYSKLISGTPTLVVLMLLFYVVFGDAEIDGIVVAIIGFIITFSAFVYSQLALTVDGIDRGQTEAAYALGYDYNQTFFRIILPQAMKMFVPVYSAEIISLIKATAVVGYIAVADLTKMGDIIRSSTYEAFFPLIAVAVIYFMITCGVASLLEILRKKTEPKRRKNENILKGVVR